MLPLNTIRIIGSLIISLAILLGAYFVGKYQGRKDFIAQGLQQQAQIAEATRQTEEKYNEQIRLLKQAHAAQSQVVKTGTVFKLLPCPTLTDSAARVLDSSSGQNTTTERIVEVPAPVGAGDSSPRVIDPEAVERNREAFEQMRAQLNALIEWAKEISK